MYELTEALGELAKRVGGLKAAVVIETSGIEVAAWGETDFEAASAEWAELWKQTVGADVLAPGRRMDSVQLATPTGTWSAFPLGYDYVLAVLADASVPMGKIRFYAQEWAQAHREDFA